MKCTLRLVVVIMLFSFLLPRAGFAQVQINEFLAKNVSTSPDMCDYDDFSDWIELYNPGNSAVNLGGYSLTDVLSTPGKWPIPSGASIPANGYLLIRADGYDDKPGSRATRPYYPFTKSFTTRRYHTNFKLNKAGEQLGLFNGNTLVDSVSYPAQLPDVSWGRNPDDNNSWYKYDEPTPGAANSTAAKPLSLAEFSPAVTFSVKGGFYSSAQTVTLSAASGSTIYYTTNGSRPTVNSTRYSSPLQVTSTRQIRARCIDTDKLAGPVATNSYFIGEKARTIAVVSIVADSSFLWDDVIGLYTNHYKQKEIPASMEFITPDGKKQFQMDMDLGPGSLTSYESPQMPFQISFESKYGVDIVDYPLFAKSFTTFRRLRLRNSDDAWATNLMSDNILEALIDRQMNCATEAYRPVVVYINGAYWGIMDLREQFDGLFFVHNWNVDTTGLTMVKRSMVQSAGGMGMASEGFELQRGTWTDWETMKSTVASGSVANIRNVVDVSSLFDGICMAHYSVAITWGHNTDYWKVDGSPWRRNLADFDRGFNYTSLAINLFSNGGGSTSGPLLTKDTVFADLVKIPEFKNYFVQRYAAHLSSTFRPERIVGIIDSISKILSSEMADHAARWKNDHGIQSLSAWQGEVDKMKKFGNERAKIAMAQLAQDFKLSGTAKLSVESSLLDAADFYVAGVRMCSGTSDLEFFTNVPLTVKAVPKQGYTFVGWESGEKTDSLTITLTGDRTLTAQFEVTGTVTAAAVKPVGYQLCLTGYRRLPGGETAIDLEYALPGTTTGTIALYSLAGRRLAEVALDAVVTGVHLKTVTTGIQASGTFLVKMKTDFGVQMLKILVD